MKRKMQMILGAALVAAMLITGMALPVWAAPAQKNVILATTTSTQDSGLLDVLIPLFEKKTGYFVKTIAVGSGQAMAMGQKGEADVLLVHSPDAEKKFMADGFGVDRLLVMHNDFIVARCLRRSGGDQGGQDHPRGLQEDRRGRRPLPVAGRQLRDPLQGEGDLEGRGHQPRGAEVVPGDGSRDGADPQRRQREEWVYPRRPGNLSGPEKESEPGYPEGGRSDPPERLSRDRASTPQSGRRSTRTGRRPSPTSWSPRRFRGSSRPSAWRSTEGRSSSPMRASRSTNNRCCKRIEIGCCGGDRRLHNIR